MTNWKLFTHHDGESARSNLEWQNLNHIRHYQWRIRDIVKEVKQENKRDCRCRPTRQMYASDHIPEAIARDSHIRQTFSGGLTPFCRVEAFEERSRYRPSRKNY